MKKFTRYIIEFVIAVAVIFGITAFTRGTAVKESLIDALIFVVGVMVLQIIIKVVNARRQKATSGFEKGLIKFLIILGHLVIIGLIALCILAGVSNLKSGEVKSYMTLFVTAVLLMLSEIYYLRKTIKK